MEFLPYPHLIPTLFNGCGFGPPPPFTAASTWTWIDHPVSGLHCLTLRPLQTWYPSGSVSLILNLAGQCNSPDRSTKSTRFHLNVVPQFVNTGFQVLFHSPPGVLFTFPSQYYALSVTKQYLALGGGPPSFPQGFSCLVVLRIPSGPFRFRLRGFHPLWLAFPKPFCCLSGPFRRSLPRGARTAVWAPSFSLAATREIDLSFFSSGYLDVSVHRVPFHTLWIGVWMTGVFPAGFPHSEICGSSDICSLPQLIAAYHVFLRLLVPRHPPCALSILTTFSAAFWLLLLRLSLHSVAGIPSRGRFEFFSDSGKLPLSFSAYLLCFSIHFRVYPRMS